jgi:hypothetical protein
MSKTTTISLTVRQVPTLPSIWTDGDIGATGKAGSAGYASGVFTVKGAGAQIFGTADAFHYVYQPLSGDGTIVARLVSMQGGGGYASAAVMIRETLTAGSRNAKTAEWPLYGGIFFDERSAPGGNTVEPGNLAVTLPYWVKMSRSGGTFSSFASSDGVNWVQVGTTQTINMAQSVYVGLAVTSGLTTALTAERDTSDHQHLERYVHQHHHSGRSDLGTVGCIRGSSHERQQPCNFHRNLTTTAG